MKMSKRILTVLCVVALFTGKSYAQGGPTPPNVYEPPPEDPVVYDPNEVPVDGGIGLVLIAGVAYYSRKKILEHKKANNQVLS